MENEDFLNVISKSFNTFLNVGTSRSTAKLKDLHGAIAKDLADKLGNEYKVSSQGYGDDKEAKIEGRYIDKMVDITISKDNNFFFIDQSLPPFIKRSCEDIHVNTSILLF